MSKNQYVYLHRRIVDFCRLNLPKAFSPREQERIRAYLLGLITQGQQPPQRGRGYDWHEIGRATAVDPEQLKQASKYLKAGLTALTLAMPPVTKPTKTRSLLAAEKPRSTKEADRQTSHKRTTASPRKRGVKPQPIIEFPEPITVLYDDPDTFCEALDLQMRRHRDTAWGLHKSVVQVGETFDMTTLRNWRRGRCIPRTVGSLEILKRIERRYRLPSGYFKRKLPHPSRSLHGHRIPGISPAEQRRLAWHLPDDFSQRTMAEREEILDWIRRVIISGSTEYRRYQAAAQKTRFALQFTLSESSPSSLTHDTKERDPFDEQDADLASSTRLAPPGLQREMQSLLRFKTATLTEIGYQRNGIWGEETADQKIEHFSLLFGALSASPYGPVKGYGAPLRALNFALLAFPAIWDWYLNWRYQRRGFYTKWEVDMLRVALALTRHETGWIRQTPDLARRLQPIRGLISAIDISRVQVDWNETCDHFVKYAHARVKEIQRIARVHRDPFEPILPILESESPVAEYRKITEEILRLLPDERRYPRARAEATRAFLMLRFGLHLGLRQKNLRQLLLCPRGSQPRSERALAERKCGEISWNERESGWQVLIPAIAFKNARSSFFANKPFRLVLPNLGDLYPQLESYVDRHRRTLLQAAPDPGTFFVKTVKATSHDAAYDQNTFYEAWRLAIQRYGIFNPYTGRGAIVGLLPHGPHNVRDVLATHILKKTGSYEQASYAIQDTPDIVAKHYGRFLPQDKAAMAARILNRVWE